MPKMLRGIGRSEFRFLVIFLLLLHNNLVSMAHGSYVWALHTEVYWSCFLVQSKWWTIHRWFPVFHLIAKTEWLDSKPVNFWKGKDRGSIVDALASFQDQWDQQKARQCQLQTALMLSTCEYLNQLTIPSAVQESILYSICSQDPGIFMLSLWFFGSPVLLILLQFWLDYKFILEIMNKN